MLKNLGSKVLDCDCDLIEGRIGSWGRAESLDLNLFVFLLHVLLLVRLQLSLILIFIMYIILYRSHG